MLKPKSKGNSLNNLKKAVPFKKGHDARRKGNGRKPKLVAHILEDLKKQGYQPVSPNQIKETYTILFNVSEEELTKIATSKDIEGNRIPYFVKKIAQAIISKEGFAVIETMLDRAHGRATQSNTVTITQLGTALRDESYTG